MNFSPNFKKKLVFLSFFIVDFFAAVEVTAMIIAAPRIADFFGLGQNLTPWIINSYLWTVSVILLTLFFLDQIISREKGGKRFFLEGLVYFGIGSLICLFSNGFPLFLFGRMVQGVGAGMSFVGQLWTITESYQKEIAKPLFWTEAGFASGIIVGPVLGGSFASFAGGGWRMIFLFNFAVCLLGAAIVSFLYKKSASPAPYEHKRGSFGRDFIFILICEAVIMLTAIAAEFLTSSYVQEIKHFPPYIAGFLILAGSLGVITGSGWIVKSDPSDFIPAIRDGLQGMTISVVLMGLSMNYNLMYLIAVSLFAVGFFMGFMGIATYAYISRFFSKNANLMIRGILLYLMTLQIASAVGVQMESVFSLMRYNFLLISFLLVIFLQICLFLAGRLKSQESAII